MGHMPRMAGEVATPLKAAVVGVSMVVGRVMQMLAVAAVLRGLLPLSFGLEQVHPLVQRLLAPPALLVLLRLWASFPWPLHHCWVVQRRSQVSYHTHAPFQ